MPKAPDKKNQPIKVGGIAFFSTLAALLILALSNTVGLVLLAPQADPLRWIYFLAGLAAGWFIVRRLGPGRVGIFLHELKHRVISNLAGNREKSLKVADNSGEFEYEYTKYTARYNALIALAPYWFPLLFVPVFVVCLLTPLRETAPALALCGLAFGIDFKLNLRDIGDHQTDLTSIRGGYAISLLFIAAMNYVICTLLAAWVSLSFSGLVDLHAPLLLLPTLIIHG